MPVKARSGSGGPYSWHLAARALGSAERTGRVGWVGPQAQHVDGVVFDAVAADLGGHAGHCACGAVGCLQDRLTGLGDAPRPGALRTIADEQAELVIARTLTERGSGQDAHWSTWSVAAATGMSQTAISRIWRAFGLEAYLSQTWKLRSDPEFIGDVGDIADVYLGPPDSRPSRLARAGVGRSPYRPGPGSRR